MIIPEWLFELPIIKPERNEILNMIELPFNSRKICIVIITKGCKDFPRDFGDSGGNNARISLASPISIQGLGESLKNSNLEY